MIKDNIKPNDMDELFDPYEVFKKEYPDKTNEWYEGYRQGYSDGYEKGHEEGHEAGIHAEQERNYF